MDELTAALIGAGSAGTTAGGLALLRRLLRRGKPLAPPPERLSQMDAARLDGLVRAAARKQPEKDTALQLRGFPPLRPDERARAVWLRACRELRGAGLPVPEDIHARVRAAMAEVDG